MVRRKGNSNCTPSPPSLIRESLRDSIRLFDLPTRFDQEEAAELEVIVTQWEEALRAIRTVSLITDQNIARCYRIDPDPSPPSHRRSPLLATSPNLSQWIWPSK